MKKTLLAAAAASLLATSALAQGFGTQPNTGPANPASTGALGASQVVKGGPGNLISFEVNADSTLDAATWYVLIFNATSAPANGAVTPTKCFQVTSGTPQMGGTYAPGGVHFTTGITIVASTTGCFTLTTSAHAFISGDAQ